MASPVNSAVNRLSPAIKTDRQSTETASLQQELNKCRDECSSLADKCRRLEEERDEAREETRGLEREIEELQDNFKEEESEQFEQLKQELELTNKNCKILQIRLAKADRQYGQLEQVKNSLERQLSEWTSSQQVNRPVSRQSSRPTNEEEDERIRDLQEQVRYSQEEAQLKGERLAAVEQENELLLTRITNLTTANSRLRVKSQASGEVDQNSLFNLESLIDQNEQLKLALEMSAADTERLRRKCNELSKLDDSSTQLENDLVGNLRKQLDAAETELANAKKRVVELDRENVRLQSQYKRLQESIEACKRDRSKRRKLPEGAARESLGRQELREALAELEKENEQLFVALQMKDKFSSTCVEMSRSGSGELSNTTNLKRALEKEQSVSESLKQLVEELDNSKGEAEASRNLLERERVCMEEEVEKLRQFNEELRAEKRELTSKLQSMGNRCRENQLNCERLRAELAEAQQVSATSGVTFKGTKESANSDSSLLARDLSELRVRNSFLMRQLELAREDSKRELEEERQSQEAQRKREVELATLEAREKNLTDCQQLRDELGELKGRLASLQRDLSRAEEELEGERERARAVDRERRREKGQFQQRLEEIEAQTGLDKRALELRLKELESGQRDKERDLSNVQERCLQVERELKRAQNKHHAHLESSESQIKSLTRELESKRRELAEVSAASQANEDKNYELTKRFNQERATLVEALESMKRSYEENLAELERVRDRLSKRQEQLFQERQMSQKRLDDLGVELGRALERQVQAKVDREMLEASERRVESSRVELARVKEERQRLRSRVAELENRCVRYEKQELASKTSSILSVKQPLFGASRFISSSSKTSAAAAPTTSNNSIPTTTNPAGPTEEAGMLEKLASKIKDQRHLTDTLRARNEQLEGELRQTRLQYSVERSKWSAREAILTSRINDCEERLMMEASLLSGNALESIRERVELQWDRERRQSMDTICQQQSQLESLSRDFRRLSQAHEFLKLQVRQLEDNNRKLAGRLMEGERPGGLCGSTKLAEQARLINEDARPLVNLVAKILEGTEKGRRSASASSEKSNVSRSSERPLIASASGQKAASGVVEAPSPVIGTAAAPKTPGSTMKRLKPKSSSLGLTVSEKQQLRQHLESLSCTLDELDTHALQTRSPASLQQRAGSELSTRDPHEEPPVRRGVLRSEQQYRASSMGRSIHWLDTSDADSEGPAGSSLTGGAAAAKRRLSYNAPAANQSPKPLSSLTDYESESSLISDLSCPPGRSSLGDSGSLPKVKRKTGLKSRFTNTLRSISRSISALTSDSESEKPPEAVASGGGVSKKSGFLREIRV